MSPEATDETKEAVKTKSSLLKWIILAVIVLLLCGGGVFGYLKFFARHGDEPAQQVVVQPVIQDMETFLVNLSDPSGKRYLKVTMKAKLSGPPVAAEFTQRIPELRDIILTLLSSKEFADIARPEDKAILKQELLAELNRVLKQGQVQDIYFTDFLVQ